MSRNNKLALLSILAIGLVLRINNLASRSLWTDEFYTLFQSSGHGVDIKNLLAQLSHKQPPISLKASEFKSFLKFDSHRSIKDVSNGLFNTDTHPPLYFWIIYLWRKLFADTVFSLRFFSVLMGIFSIFLAYKVTGYLFNQDAQKDAAKFCALFVSISAFNIRYSQEARAYSLIMVLGLLTWLFMLRMENYNKNSDAFCFALFNALGFYTHYFYIFISVAQFAYFTVAHRQNNAMLKKFYSAFLWSALFFSPWFIALILKGYNFYLADWIFGYPGLGNKIYYLFSGITRYVLILDASNMPSILFLFIGALLFIYLASLAIKDMVSKYPRQFLFCLVMFLMPLLGMFFIDILQHGALLKQERFWIFPFLGFIPLAGYSLSFGFSKIKIVAYMLVLMMCVSSVTVSKMQFGPAPKYASIWINQESAGSQSAVIVYNIRSVVFAQSYYLDGRIYLLPVSDQGQLKNCLKTAHDYADKIFIVRHYHPSDSSLMDQPFMEIDEAGSGFKFKTAINRDGVSVSEYIK